MALRVALVAVFLFFIADPFKLLVPTITPSDKEVVMYSTSWCGYCRKARETFVHNNIAFKELDIEQSATAKAEYDALGGRGVPLILIDDVKVTGFNIGEFKRHYEN